MRRLVEKFLGSSDPVKKSVKLCENHAPNMFKNIKASESCLTCGVDMCYLCGNQHSI